MRGQLTTLNYLIKQKRFEEASKMLNKLDGKLDSNTYKQSGNDYVDAILRQKMSEYAHIHFDLYIQITKDFNMDGKDIVSIFEFYLEQNNHCRYNIDFKSNKQSQNHGLGLKILQSIVNKYNARLKYEAKNNTFNLAIYLSFF